MANQKDTPVDPLDKLVLDEPTESKAMDALDVEFPGIKSLGLKKPSSGKGQGVTKNRERHFNRESARFHDPDTGMFEPGRAPPDLDTGVDRYRAKDGKFKKSSADLYDEQLEVSLDSLDPEG